ncbi:hypothetical protein WH221_05455 [Chryseobacterium culicis]|uniref:N-acetyltransferase domain-containing protein n=1 Tax=Chryseobacterium culicis TaxID=680127 RepID=A0A2S9CYV0_CHRCI|nr:hypothetical protein [Chryseobacterium culicis]PRB85695.1 hypothetical protein CQ022_05410 [Chryseobacterium culicis]PRB90581.1 hypothetical protein CQ033_07575 [Chryseobacterium culicis]
MDIISKFTVGSEEGISDLITIIDSSVYTLYREFVSEEEIKRYIQNEIDPRKMINDLNDLSNQLIMMYADQKPIGYSIIKSGSLHPGIPEGKRATEITFVILPEYDCSETRQSLWKKCRSAVSFTDVIWINILDHDPLADFLKEFGFVVVDSSRTGPFQLPSHILELEVNKS